MAHPGRIVYAHPPQTDGIRFFYITYSRRRSLCELKMAAEEGEPTELEIAPLDLIAMLEEGRCNGTALDDNITRRALKALLDLAERRGLS
ncbi:MAG: hypothetical protein ABFE16_13875 [Armatimonadia bacterium]